VTVRHEVNNALTAIVAESEILLESKDGLTEEHRRTARAIKGSALKISEDLRKLTTLVDAPVTEYTRGVNMLDLKAARTRP
jgi:hypothetical protein